MQRVCKANLLSPCAPVAQLDRASGYEPEGREFESLRAHHFPIKNEERARFNLEFVSALFVTLHDGLGFRLSYLYRKPRIPHLGSEGRSQSPALEKASRKGHLKFTILIQSGLTGVVQESVAKTIARNANERATRPLAFSFRPNVVNLTPFIRRPLPQKTVPLSKHPREPSIGAWPLPDVEISARRN